jgi:RpiR family carbohydrate utilization transcriptional regulator
MSDSPISPAGSLLLFIRGLLPTLNEQEQKVGQYVLDHPDEVIHLAMSDLAHRCAVSETTVFRFCRKVQVDGYQELKIQLALESEPGRAAAYATVEPGDSLARAALKVIAADAKALEDTLSILDPAVLERAADALLAARRIDIYGAGGGAIAAAELQYKLLRTGLPVATYTDAEMQLISAALLTPTDVVLAISHSGESKDLVRAFGVAKERGARTIAITNHPASSLARLAEINLHTAAQEALAHGYPLGARVAQIGMIDLLHTTINLKRAQSV